MMMKADPQPEVWMRGPIIGVPPMLQPVAHALLQAKEEIETYLNDFDDRLLWAKPAGVASVGFHLLHITGVVDRMFTYALDKPLADAQFEYLRTERQGLLDITAAELVAAFGDQVGAAVTQLKETDEAQLTHIRYLGRKRVPTTLIGLLFHAAEHTQRHVGQLLVTVTLLPFVNEPPYTGI